MKLEINKLKPNKDNPRIIKDDKFKKLVKSIKDFPEMLELRPIVVDEDMTILGGNMRYKACIEAGLKEVYIKIAEGLTEEQKQEFIIKDNVGFGEWEWDILANEWDSTKLAEWGLDVWENIDDAEPEEGLIEDDEIPEVKESKVKRGDIWQLGEHRIMCGDSTNIDDVAKLMNGEKADMVFTDPPYGVDYDGGHAVKGVRREKLKNDGTPDIYNDTLPIIYMFSKKDTPLYLWYSDSKSLAVLSAVLSAGYEIRNNIIWNKNVAQFGAIGAQYKTKHEPCLYCYKKGQKTNWIGPNNEVSVWDINRNSKNEYHPTQKPIALAERCIKNHTVKLILDIFLGSGSTLIAAEKLNRKCYGMELDEKYCDVIIERWEQFTGKKAEKIN